MAVVDNLRRFNRKERFFAIGMVLGNPDFRICEEFKLKLNRSFGLSVTEHAFCAMDYHLDWLYASLYLSDDKPYQTIHRSEERMIRATQEDIDLLVAYDQGGVCHIIMLEAKGVTGWTNEQLNSKAGRLQAIFSNDGTKWPHVVPHFAIVSPQKPRNLDLQSWPTWMKPGGELKWIRLPIPRDLERVTRCDEKGRPYAKGAYWRAVPAAYHDESYASPQVSENRRVHSVLL